MSVAFRRESDEEHKEPRFELPIPAGPNLVTAAGSSSRTGCPQSKRRLPDAPTRDAVELLMRQKRYWQTRHATAELAPIPTGDEVAFGTRVTFRLKGKVRTIDIVGDDEADPATNRISFSAPLVRALLGASPGDICAFGGDDQAAEIIDISPAA
ncbi:MAG: GreA/GreB family elongation factor [Sphingomonadales bacterium]|nr:GreA/GreB family elongation factor [Sphingomonadales bacterium]